MTTIASLIARVLRERTDDSATLPCGPRSRRSAAQFPHKLIARVVNAHARRRRLPPDRPGCCGHDVVLTPIVGMVARRVGWCTTRRTPDQQSRHCRCRGHRDVRRLLARWRLRD